MNYQPYQQEPVDNSQFFGTTYQGGQRPYEPRYENPVYNRSEQQNIFKLDDSTNIVITGGIGSGLTSSVYKAYIYEEPEPKCTYALKILHKNVSSDAKLMVVDMNDTNKCRCLPYIYIKTEKWMLMEYYRDSYISLRNAVNIRYYLDIDTAINLTTGVLQCLKELHKYNLDYVDISDFNVAISTRKYTQSEVRLFDHGGVSTFNDTKNVPFDNTRYRSLSVIMDNNKMYCSDKNAIIEQKLYHDSTCSVLFMMLSWLIFPPWHTTVIRDGSENWFGKKYPLLNSLYLNRRNMKKSKTDPMHHEYDSSPKKEYERSCKNLIKYRTFYAIIDHLFKNKSWDEIDNNIFNDFDTYRISLRNYFEYYNNSNFQNLISLYKVNNIKQFTIYLEEMYYIIATVCLLIIWTTARVKTNPQNRNIDFVISKLEGLRLNPYKYDWKIRKDTTNPKPKKLALYLGDYDYIYEDQIN